MRILVLHNLYQQRGGEDAVVEAETALLRAGGHDVRIEKVHNDQIVGFASKAKAFANAAYDAGRYCWMQDILQDYPADIVHIHNFFPLLTPAVHAASTDMGVPVVQSLHNFRITCANAMLLRDGQICEKCVGGNKLWGVYHRCYRGSLPGSLAVVNMQIRAQRESSWFRHVHRFIALTEFGKNKFVRAGLPADRIVVKPNFLSMGAPVPREPRSGGLFVGRLSEEKGAHLLIEAWRHLPDVGLTIAGDGPERKRLEATAPANIRFLGQVDPAEVAREMARAAFLVIPSICYEGFPMTVVEAFSRELPILASRIGALAEIVTSGANGDLFEPGRPDSIVEAVRRFLSEASYGPRLGAGALRSYLSLYTSERNLKQLETIYAEAIEQRAADMAANNV
ncbi:glycosyltransferase family 4 protein [Devosia elaeis]|uniref:Glycosyl transferase family 1 n=1 Tax=Devosia elaeis TaxID=1770058 RepID=A0A178I305_9HYPH|nr:glycosyltransferase family 4 protein [Devosia elaeis]OAM78575.1 hypothetical protein A3840_05625 [Devosia elaeis]